MKDHICISFSPDKTYTRHSEGAFLRLNDGGIIFIYSRFTGSSHDDAPSDLVKLYSYDEGETWSEPEIAVRASMYNTKNIMSVSLLRMENGDLGLFYLVKKSAGVNAIMLSRSADEGKTFYTHTVCDLADRPGYYVMNNDRVVRLSSGRLVLPLTFHRGSYDEETKSGWFDGRAYGCFLLSDDDGRTFHEGRDTVFAALPGSDSALQECGVIEKKNGILWAYFRTDMMYQYECFSFDGGEHWTAVQPSRFTSPCSPMKLARHENGDIYSVWNPIPNYNGRYRSPAGWGRTPLVYAVSHDDGESWSDYKIIEGEEDHGYCYPAVFFTSDNAMLVGYCAGGPEDDCCCLAKLTIKKLSLLD